MILLLLDAFFLQLSTQFVRAFMNVATVEVRNVVSSESSGATMYNFNVYVQAQQQLGKLDFPTHLAKAMPRRYFNSLVLISLAAFSSFCTQSGRMVD